MLARQTIFVILALVCFAIGFAGKRDEHDWLSGGLFFLTVAWFISSAAARLSDAAVIGG